MFVKAGMVLAKEHRVCIKYQIQ